jgi:hypothetical protein
MIFNLKEPLMSEDIKQQVDTSSAEFKEGVEVGLNSSEDRKNWQAGIELGQELKDEGEDSEPVSEILFKEPSTPLFIRGGNEGNAQDEKDETEE